MAKRRPLPKKLTQAEIDAKKMTLTAKRTYVGWKSRGFETLPASVQRDMVTGGLGQWKTDIKWKEKFAEEQDYRDSLATKKPWIASGQQAKAYDALGGMMQKDYEGAQDQGISPAQRGIHQSAVNQAAMMRAKIYKDERWQGMGKMAGAGLAAGAVGAVGAPMPHLIGQDFRTTDTEAQYRAMSSGLREGAQAAGSGAGMAIGAAGGLPGMFIGQALGGTIGKTVGDILGAIWQKENKKLVEAVKESQQRTMGELSSFIGYGGMLGKEVSQGISDSNFNASLRTKHFEEINAKQAEISKHKRIQRDLEGTFRDKWAVGYEEAGRAHRHAKAGYRIKGLQEDIDDLIDKHGFK